jgi:hypothetical protein
VHVRTCTLFEAGVRATTAIRLNRVGRTWPRGIDASWPSAASSNRTIRRDLDIAVVACTIALLGLAMAAR